MSSKIGIATCLRNPFRDERLLGGKTDEFGEQPAIAAATAVRQRGMAKHLICHMMADVQTRPEIVSLIVGWLAWIRTRPRTERAEGSQGLEKSFVYPVSAAAASSGRIPFSLISRDRVRQVQQVLFC
mgnify:CR=1 FL=1